LVEKAILLGHRQKLLRQVNCEAFDSSSTVRFTK
jgi:hypothetical protein